MDIELFHEVSWQCSRVTTKRYSTSFASAIKLLHPDLRQPIYNIYGLVRFADEIVDTFEGFDKARLLENFKRETFSAIEDRISLNPILNSFQKTINQYKVDHALIHAFFKSMQMDLHFSKYDADAYSEYIYGSAEVVGLMCLYIFCEGDKERYTQLTPAARSLGAAFQKVNFLRDMKADYSHLARTYFPGIDMSNFSSDMKQQIENEIAVDFDNAFEGIRQLPLKARFGVYVAYKYYFSLFKKIRKVRASHILQQRVRIPDYQKAMILARAGVKNQLNLI